MKIHHAFQFFKKSGIHNGKLHTPRFLIHHLTAILSAIALIFGCFLGPYASYVLSKDDSKNTDPNVLLTESVSQINSTTNNLESIYPTLDEQSQNDMATGDNRSKIIASLYAKYAVIMDADNQRILLGKNESTSAPNASTTKIMTCIIALEYGNQDALCTASKYSASMPDVQLNANTGEMFHLKDLLYSLMLKSHNDTAVIVAENVAYNYIWQVKHNNLADTAGVLNDKDLTFVPVDSDYNSAFLSTISDQQSKTLVSVFAGLMNEKAASLGCEGTHFITPNGLDAADETSAHVTTPSDLAKIMSYCIKNQDFLTITETPSYNFQSEKINSKGEIVSDDSYSVTNANAFLHMYDNIISGKTGFTGDAGYCYVCAYRCDNRSFVVVLLACGWPNNKTYKWHDARLLLNWAREKYFQKDIVGTDLKLKNIQVKNGKHDSVSVSVSESLQMLLSDFDVVNVVVNTPVPVKAPIHAGDQVGNVNVYVNDTLVKELPIISNENVEKTSFLYFIKKALKSLTFVDN